jgi:hypothetical protein
MLRDAEKLGFVCIDGLRDSEKTIIGTFPSANAPFANAKTARSSPAASVFPAVTPFLPV